MRLWTCPRASESIVAVLADRSEGVAHMDPAVGEGVGGADDGACSVVDLVGDDAGALHEQCAGFGDVSGFEFVDGGQVFVAAHQDGRGHALDDAADEAVGDGSVVEGVECCFDGAATVVAEDDDEWYVEDADGVFDGAEDVDDSRPNLDHLRRARSDLNSAVFAAHGVELYKKLGEHDEREFNGLALCTNDSIGQRDLSFLMLTKAVVDAIDVKVIRKLAGTDKSETSLNALQSWIEQLGGDVDELCGPLRLLQSMRSSGSAHLKGSRYSAALAAEGWDKMSPSKQFEDLVDRVTRALRDLAQLVAPSSQEP